MILKMSKFWQKRHASRIPTLIFFTNICAYWLKKTFFKFIKDKREIGVILLAAIFL